MKEYAEQMEKHEKKTPVAKHATSADNPSPCNLSYRDALKTIDEMATGLTTTNDESTDYFFRFTNLQCFNSNFASTIARAVCNSGAWPHMFNKKEYFSSLQPWSSTYPKQGVDLAATGNTVPIRGGRHCEYPRQWKI